MGELDTLRLAISDPNATTPRLPNEHLTDWIVRAILASDWLAAHVERATADAEARLAQSESTLAGLRRVHAETVDRYQHAEARLAAVQRKADHAAGLARLVDEWAARAGRSEASLAAVRDLRDGWQAEVEDDGDGLTNLATVLAEVDAALDPAPTTDADGRDERRDGAGGTRWERG